MNSGDIREYVLRDLVPHPAFPGHALHVKGPDTENELVRFFLQRLHDLRDALRRVLSVRICRHTAHCVGLMLQHMLKSRLERASFPAVHVVAEQRSARCFQIVFCFCKNTAVLFTASVIDDDDRSETALRQLREQLEQSLVRLISRNNNRDHASIYLFSSV